MIAALCSWQFDDVRALGKIALRTIKRQGQSRWFERRDFNRALRSANRELPPTTTIDFDEAASNRCTCLWVMQNGKQLSRSESILGRVWRLTAST